MITLNVNIDGVLHKLETLTHNAEDLKPALARIGGYLRSRAQERYEAQDFAPLAAGTIAHRAQKGLRRLEVKLQRDVRRAIKRAGEQRSPRGLLERVLSLNVPNFAPGVSRGVQNRLSVLAEFQRRHRREKSERVLGGKELSLKQQVSLSGRELRAIARVVGGPILGGLPRTLFVFVDANANIASRTHQKWSEIHNQGGTAGHGASIPKRETIRVDQSDIPVMQEIIRDHMTTGLEE